MLRRLPGWRPQSLPFSLLLRPHQLWPVSASFGFSSRKRRYIYFLFPGRRGFVVGRTTAVDLTPSRGRLCCLSFPRRRARVELFLSRRALNVTSRQMMLSLRLRSGTERLEHLSSIVRSLRNSENDYSYLVCFFYVLVVALQASKQKRSTPSVL